MRLVLAYASGYDVVATDLRILRTEELQELLDRHHARTNHADYRSGQRDRKRSGGARRPRRLARDRNRDIMLKPMPKGAFISIEELYGIVAFLVSDVARNITGQAITVDGGWTIL
jgi:hypothetical protein